MNKQTQELIAAVSDLLSKHKVDNEVLAADVAIFVLEREKAAIRAAQADFTNMLRTI